jgi:hypothetical protein
VPQPPLPPPPKPVQPRTQSTCGVFNNLNSLECSIPMCPYQTLISDLCSEIGDDTLLSLFNYAKSALYASDDDGCGAASGPSYLSYTSFTTETVTLRGECSQGNPCNATLLYSIVGPPCPTPPQPPQPPLPPYPPLGGGFSDTSVFTSSAIALCPGQFLNVSWTNSFY